MFSKTDRQIYTLNYLSKMLQLMSIKLSTKVAVATAAIMILFTLTLMENKLIRNQRKYSRSIVRIRSECVFRKSHVIRFIIEDSL